MIRNLLLAFTVIGLLLYWFSQEVTQQFQLTGGGRAVAVVKEAYGTIKVKSPSQSEWRDLRFNRMLRSGDTVFVGENSKLVYTYKREAATITLPSDSVVEITDTPVMASQMGRAFYSTASVGENKGTGQWLRSNRIYVRMERAPVNQQERESEDPAKGKDEGGTAYFRLDRKAKAIRIVEPRGNLTIHTGKLPLSFRVILERPSTPKKIFGYLWKEGGATTPLWSAVLDKPEFENIPLPALGEFVFQAVSEGDEYVSPLVRVSVSEKGDAVQEIAQSFLPEVWSGKHVLVLR